MDTSGGRKWGKVHYFAYHRVCCARFEDDLENYQNLSLQWSIGGLYILKDHSAAFRDGKQALHGRTFWESVLVLQVRDFDGLEEGGTVEMDPCK